MRQIRQAHRMYIFLFVKVNNDGISHALATEEWRHPKDIEWPIILQITIIVRFY